MPTFSRTNRFNRDYVRLNEEEKQAFNAAVRKFVEDLKAGHRFRRGLRVKGIQGAQGIFEMTWAPDGRATFSYGPERREGEPHVIWRRVGTHSILQEPEGE